MSAIVAERNTWPFPVVDGSSEKSRVCCIVSRSVFDGQGLSIAPCTMDLRTVTVLVVCGFVLI